MNIIDWASTLTNSQINNFTKHELIIRNNIVKFYIKTKECLINYSYEYICCEYWFAGAVKATRSANISRLKYVKTHTFSDCISVYSVCALSADELLVSCGYDGLFTLSLRTGLRSALHFKAHENHVRKVAFDTRTGTLILLVSNNNVCKWLLVSLRRKSRNASEWLEVQRLETIWSSLRAIDFAMTVCDSRVLLARTGEGTLFVFDVSATHTLHQVGQVDNSYPIWSLACTRQADDILVAVGHSFSVSLQRLTSNPLGIEPILNATSKHQSTWTQQLLFRGELLLAAHYVDLKYVIVSFRATLNALTARRVLFNAGDNGYHLDWTIAGDQLVTAYFNYFTASFNSLLVYDFE